MSNKTYADLVWEKAHEADIAAMSFFVVYVREHGCHGTTYFECQADDADHAKEQAQDAYPGASVLDVTKDPDYIIFSAYELRASIDGLGGYWSNEDGWGDLASATAFKNHERNLFSLPLADAQFVLKAKAIADAEVQKTHVRLVLDVSYDDMGISPRVLQNMLEQMVSHAIGNGALTGGLEATVDEWTVSTATIPGDAMDLDEEEVASWLSSQMEDGQIDPARIPVLMARYALTDSAQMKAELAERMGLL